MSTSISEHFTLFNANNNPEVIEIYINDSDQVFVQDKINDMDGFFFTLTREEWEEIKEFIDNQYSKI